VGRSRPTSATKIAGYFAAHDHKAMMAHLLIDGAAGAAIVAIAYSLRDYLAAEGRLPQVMFASGIAAGLASLGQAVVGETLTYRAAHGASAGSVKTLFKVLNNGDTVKIALLAVMIGAASVLARRFGAFPRWLGIGRARVRATTSAQWSRVPAEQRCALRITRADTPAATDVGNRSNRGGRASYA
jgi:hypothetical protein